MSDTLRGEELRALMTSWLPEQRWFAGKGRPMTVAVRPIAKQVSAEGELALVIVTVSYEDDGSATETYQVPLVLRDQPVGSLDHVLLGPVDTDEHPRWVYDALHDKEVTQWWLTGFRDDRVTDGLRFRAGVEPSALPIGEPSLAQTGEQSNTSLVFGDQAIMKVFRRLDPGLNPDVEVHRALSGLGARHIARLFGDLEADIDGERYSLAMLQEFLTTATDGWELAKISVRDLMAEGDLHAAEAGGDFAAEAERLGIAAAEVHADLVNAFGSDVLYADSLQPRAAQMNARLDDALRVVPQLAEVEEPLRAAFDAIASDGAKPVTIQRIHGDLHLGQVLRTALRWVFLDFEGEPARPLRERQHLDSPLRDVASMLRSFDYAANHQAVDVDLDAQRRYRAGEWATRNRAAFCNGYAQAAGRDPRNDAALLRAFEADKAVYETVYETRHRPDWLPVPLASLSRLTQEETAVRE